MPGLKATLIVQVAPAASRVPQVVAVRRKSAAPGPVKVTGVDANANWFVWLFLTVSTSGALVDPTAASPKPRDAGDSSTRGTRRPAQGHCQGIGHPGALIVSVPVTTPTCAACGANLTCMLQPPPAPTLSPQPVALNGPDVTRLI